MKRIMIVLLAVLALAACGSDSTSEPTPAPSDETPSAVIEGVRAEYPHTRTDDIAISYADIKEQDPNATDSQAVQWMVEAIAANEAVKAWNECLEANDGRNVGCIEPPDEPLSEDNPLGW
jgi:hypothetical protein